MKQQKKTCFLVSAFIAILVILILLSLNSLEGYSDKIKIGVAMHLTGFGSTWGENSRDGILLAAKEINNAGGINGKKLEIIFEDTQTEPNVAVNAANKLINMDKVKIIVTGWSQETEAVSPLLKENKIIGITVSGGSPNLTQGNAFLFRVWPSDGTQSKKIAEFANKKGYKKVAIIQTIGTWEEGVANVFRSEWKSLGNEIVLDYKILPDEMDFRSFIISINNSDFIYLALNSKSAGRFIKQYIESGGNLPLFYISDINDNTIIDGVSGISNFEKIKIFYPVFKSPSEEFKSNFILEFNRTPGISADTAYDAIKIIKIILEKDNNANTESLREALYSVNYTGASGEISFNEDGDREKADVVIMTFKDGEFIKLE